MKISCEQTISRPPTEVFAAISDFATAADRVTGIIKTEMLTDEPVGVGTRFRETRKMFGKTATEEMTVAEFEPPHRYVLHAASHGCRYVTEFRVEPVAGGSRVTMDFSGVPLTFMAKIMSFLMKPMIKSIRKLVAKDLADIKSSLETG